jgi:hypothetical protein
LSDVRAAVDNWSGFALQAKIPPALIDRVAKDLLPL